MSGWSVPNNTAAAGDTLRTPLAQRVMSAVVLAIITPVGLGMTLLGLILTPQSFGLGAFVALMGALMLSLVLYTGRDALAKFTFRAQFGPSAVTLSLPGARSLIHRLRPFNGAIAYADIAAIETRLEAYRSLGAAAMQRTYAIRNRNGEMLILGEDRAAGTAMAQTNATDLVNALVTRTGAPVHDLGMVEGKGGILLVAGAAPDAWTAASLPDDEQARLWRRVALTGALPMLILVLAWTIAALA